MAKQIRPMIYMILSTHLAVISCSYGTQSEQKSSSPRNRLALKFANLVIQVPPLEPKDPPIYIEPIVVHNFTGQQHDNPALNNNRQKAQPTVAAEFSEEDQKLWDDLGKFLDDYKEEDQKIHEQIIKELAEKEKQQQQKPNNSEKK